MLKKKKTSPDTYIRENEIPQSLLPPKPIQKTNQRSMPSTEKPPDLIVPNKESSSDESLESLAKRDGKRKGLGIRKQLEKSIKKSCTSWWIRFSCLFLSPIFWRQRHRFILIIEVLVPVCITLALCGAFTMGISWKSAHFEKVTSETSKFPRFDSISVEKAADIFRKTYLDSLGRVLIFFAPVNNLTVPIMAQVVEILKIDSQNRMDITGKKGIGVVGLPNEIELLDKAIMHQNEKRHKQPVGVYFQYDPDNVEDDTELPKHMSYYIRTFDERISQTDEFPYVEPVRKRDALPVYVESGFIGLQYAIEYSYLRILLHKKNEGNKSEQAHADVSLFDDLFHNEGTEESERLKTLDEIPAMKLRMFYAPSFFNQKLRTMSTIVVSFAFVVAYLFTSFFIVRQIVYENKSGIKDILRMHGMPFYLHWIILVVHAIIFRGITAILTTVILIINFSNGAILEKSNLILMSFIFWQQLLALTFFNFFLATLVNSVTFVGVYSTMIGLLSFVVPVTCDQFELLGMSSNLFLVFIFPNWGLYNLIKVFLDYEFDDKGVTWKNVHKLSHESGSSIYLPILQTSIIISISGLVYLFLAIYTSLTSQSTLFPPAHKWWDIWGKAQQWLNLRAQHKILLQETKDEKLEVFDKPTNYEEPEADQKCLVRIRHLCKRYGRHKIAIDTLNLNIMHEEITVLLGHSGCGKSTIVNILAGVTSPTLGFATIKDHNVSYEKSKSRHYTGLCTQALVYYNLLTVKQHVFLCYRLRGYNKEECHRNSSTLLTRLRLWDLKETYPDKLTKDELRRLGVGMAMADAPKVLLLDEPTNGMDAAGREEIWSILIGLKSHHTIVLTSNYIEEAERLADRIALIAHGRLVCFGSADFLKQQYETGHFLKIKPMPFITRLDSNAIMAVLKTRFGTDLNEKKKKAVKDADNLIIALPQDKLEQFVEMCNDLDKVKAKYGIKKYAIEEVKLSDVFITISESSSAETAPELKAKRGSSSAEDNPAPKGATTEHESLSKKKFYWQFYAIFRKRIIYLCVKNEFFLWEYILPMGLIFVVMWQATHFLAPPWETKPKNFTVPSAGNKTSVFVRVRGDSYEISYSSHISKILGTSYQLLPKTETMLEFIEKQMKMISEKSNGSLGEFREHHMTAIELRRSPSGKDNSYEFIGYFGSGAMHSAPLVLNTIMNVLLRTVTGKKADPYRIHAVNKPFPTTFIYAPGRESRCTVVCSIFAILLSFAYSLISNSTISFPMKERRKDKENRSTEIKTQVPPAVYWISNYVCDFFIMLFITLIIGASLLFFASGTFKDKEPILILALFTMMYLAWAGIAFTYFISSVLPAKYKGFNFMTFFHIMFCLFPFAFLEFALSADDSATVVFFRYLFMTFPGYVLTCCVQDWFDSFSKRYLCQGVIPEMKKMCNISTISHPDHVKHTGHFATEGEMIRDFLKRDKQNNLPPFAPCCERYCKFENKEEDECFVRPTVMDPKYDSFAQPHLVVDVSYLAFLGLLYWVLLLVSERGVVKRLVDKIMSASKWHKKNTKAVEPAPPAP